MLIECIMLSGVDVQGPGGLTGIIMQLHNKDHRASYTTKDRVQSLQGAFSGDFKDKLVTLLCLSIAGS